MPLTAPAPRAAAGRGGMALFLIAATLSVAALGSAVWVLTAGPGASPRAIPRPAAPWPAAPIVPAATSPRAAPSPRRSPAGESGPPVRMAIPSIGVRSRVVPLGLNPDGTLEVPTDYAVAGWWSGGTRPGDVGPAVIVGHVDSRSGPAVFYRLRDLRPGNRIVVWRRDGSVVRFVVERLQQLPKSGFPTQEVYGEVPYVGLRLVTCGGAFDRSTGHYVDNVIVFARVV
jgi:Sortase domain